MGYSALDLWYFNSKMEDVFAYNLYICGDYNFMTSWRATLVHGYAGLMINECWEIDELTSREAHGT